MKKIIFFVLIAALFCFSIEQNDVDLDEDVVLEFSIKKALKKLGRKAKNLGGKVLNLPKSIKKNINKVWKEVKKDASKAIQFLKESGIYDKALEVLKTTGKEAAVDACVAEEIPKDVCQEMVDLVATNIS